MSRLLLIGGGGHGRVAADTAIAAGYHDIAFLDQLFPGMNACGNWPVIGTPSDPDLTGDRFIAVGKNQTRAKLWNDLDTKASPVLVHPFSWIAPSVSLADGCLIVGGVVINTGVRIGLCGIINTGASLDHDCILGDFVHISPGARLAGDVQIGDRSWIGIGAVIREGTKIGADVTVGAGAVVISDLPDGTTVVGNPARPVQRI